MFVIKSIRDINYLLYGAGLAILAFEAYNCVACPRNCLEFNSISSFFTSFNKEAQSVTVKSTGCGFDPHSRKWNIYLYFYFHLALVSRQSAALSSATQHAMPAELGGKWGTECLNTRFPLSACCVRDTAWSW